LPLDILTDRRRTATGGFDQVRGQPILVVEQHFKQVQRRDLLVTTAQRKILRRLNQGLETIRIFLDLHSSAPGVYLDPLTAAADRDQRPLSPSSNSASTTSDSPCEPPPEPPPESAAARFIASPSRVAACDRREGACLIRLT